MAITKWLHYADHSLAPMCRSPSGSICRSLTRGSAKNVPRPSSIRRLQRGYRGTAVRLLSIKQETGCLRAKRGERSTWSRRVQRLLRYCARPPFALEHLHEHHAGHLVYRCPKPRPGGPSALVLTPLELIDKIAALVPPPRTHRHRYYGVLAPNAPLRAALTALAPVPVPPPPPADPAGAQQAAAQRAAARYLWAMLLARIYAVLPRTCPFCLAAMRPAGSTLGVRIIAFITEPSTVRQMLDHLGEATRPPRFAPPRFAPARGPPLWAAAAAAAASNDPAWDHTPRRHQRSNSISASPGDAQLLPRPG